MRLNIENITLESKKSRVLTRILKSLSAFEIALCLSKLVHTPWLTIYEMIMLITLFIVIAK